MNCSAQKIGQIIHFISKKSFNIDGFGEKQAIQLFNLKYVKNFIDIFKLENFKGEILKLEGWGELSFKNLINAVNKSKNISLEKFIFSLGIRYIGETNSTILANEFKSMNKFLNSINNSNLIFNVDGLGPKAVYSLRSFFSLNENIKLVKELGNIVKINKFEISSSKNFFFK